MHKDEHMRNPCFDLPLLYSFGLWSSVQLPRNQEADRTGRPYWAMDVMGPQLSAVTCTQRSLCKEVATEGGRDAADNEGRENCVRQAASEREEDKEGEEGCHHKEPESFLLFWI